MDGLLDRPASLGEPLVIGWPRPALRRRFAKLVERDLIEIVDHSL